MRHTVKEVLLANGAKGLFIDIPEATVMSYQFHFRAGNRQVRDKSIYETAHIMEHMAFGANAKFDNEQQYAAEFSKNGAYDNAYTADNSMVYMANCADFEWERILRLQQVAICQPKFNEAKLQSEKGNVKNELSGMLSSHSNLLWPRLQKMVGQDILTLSERLKTIDRITLDDIQKHHDFTHTSSNLRFVIAGNLTNRKTKIRKILEGWKLKKGSLLEIPKDIVTGQAEPTLIKRLDSKSLTFGFSLVLDRTLTENERNALGALNHLLTGTLHSRIFGKAREDGLVYSMFSDFDNDHYSSSWDFAGQVLPETAPKLFLLIADELRSILAGNIKEQEVSATKSYALGRYQMGAQTVAQISNFYTTNYFSKDEICKYKRVPREISRVDKEAMVSIARDFAKNGKRAFAAVGNASSKLIEELNQIINEVRYE